MVVMGGWCGVSVTHRFLEVQLFTDYKNGDEINLSTLFNLGKVIFTMYTFGTCKHIHSLSKITNACPSAVCVVHLSHKQNNRGGWLLLGYYKLAASLMVPLLPRGRQNTYLVYFPRRLRPGKPSSVGPSGGSNNTN